MAHFVEGIKNFETMGAPDLHGPVMTWEDIQFATRMNKLEIENCLNQSIEFFDEKVFDDKEFIDDNEDGCSNNLKEAYGMFFEDSKNIHCGKGLEEAALNSELARTLEKVTDKGKEGASLATALFSDTLDNDDKLRELKIFMKMQEQGLSIDYRCPAHAKGVRMLQKQNTFHYEKKRKTKQ